MNFMMAAMAPVMSFLMMGRDMRGMQPTELLFWGIMSLGIIAGFVFAYPANVWMVLRNLKHGLMTERKPGTAFDLGKPEPQKSATPAMAMGGAHAGMSGMDHQNLKGDSNEKGGHGAGHSMKSDATWPQIAGLGLASLVALLTGMALRPTGSTLPFRRGMSEASLCRRA